MHYLDVAEAKTRPGLKLVLSAHVPGPWGEAAKALFGIREVPFLPVAQLALEPNDALHDWIGLRNAPAAVTDDAPPVTNWLDLAMLAERLGSGPSLLPADSAQRALATGISAEICAPGGFGWCRRLSIFRNSFGPGDLPDSFPDHLRAVCRHYDYTPQAAAAAPRRLADIMAMLTGQLLRQQRSGSEYLVGDGLTICDIHWACFSMMVSPLPPHQAAVSAQIQTLYSTLDPQTAAALHPILIEHRNRIYQRHIGLPLDF